MEALWTNPGLTIIALKIIAYCDLNSLCHLNSTCLAWCEIISNSLVFYQKILEAKLKKHQDKKWMSCHTEWKNIIEEILQSQNVPKMILMSKNLYKMSKVVDKKSTEHLYTITPLHLAVENGDAEFFDFILPILIDKNPKAYSGMTPLHYACKNGHLEFCKKLLHNLKIKNPLSKTNTTPLHFAAKHGHMDVAKLLLEESCNENINVQDIDGLTALHLSVKFGHIEVVKILLEHSCRTDVMDNERLTPYLTSVIYEKFNIFQLLVALQPDPNPWFVHPVSGERTTLMHHACQNGLKKFLELIFESNQDKNPLDDSSQSLLHCACSKGHLDIVEYLLNHDFDLQQKCKNGRVPLHCAAIRGSLQCCQILVKTMIDIKIEDKHGKTPLDYAQKRGNLTLTKLLSS